MVKMLKLIVIDICRKFLDMGFLENKLKIGRFLNKSFMIIVSLKGFFIFEKFIKIILGVFIFNFIV